MGSMGSPKDISKLAVQALDAINVAIASIVFLDEWHKLPDRLGAQSTRLTSQLADGLNKPAASVAPPARQRRHPHHLPISISRRDLLIRWLRSHGYAADATELDGRLTLLLRSLSEWEENACRAMRDNRTRISEALREKQVPSLYDWFGTKLCDELNDVLDEATRILCYGRQLAQTLSESRHKGRAADDHANNETEATPGYFSAAELAKRHNLSDKELLALRKRLQRWRAKATEGKDWSKLEFSGNNKDQFLYREQAVTDVVRGYQVSTCHTDVAQE